MLPNGAWPSADWHWATHYWFQFRRWIWRAINKLLNDTSACTQCHSCTTPCRYSRWRNCSLAEFCSAIYTSSNCDKGSQGGSCGGQCGGVSLWRSNRTIQYLSQVVRTMESMASILFHIELWTGSIVITGNQIVNRSTSEVFTAKLCHHIIPITIFPAKAHICSRFWTG